MFKNIRAGLGVLASGVRDDAKDLITKAKVMAGGGQPKNQEPVAAEQWVTPSARLVSPFEIVRMNSNELSIVTEALKKMIVPISDAVGLPTARVPHVIVMPSNVVGKDANDTDSCAISWDDEGNATHLHVAGIRSETLTVFNQADGTLLTILPTPGTAEHIRLLMLNVSIYLSLISMKETRNFALLEEQFVEVLKKAEDMSNYAVSKVMGAGFESSKWNEAFKKDKEESKILDN